LFYRTPSNKENKKIDFSCPGFKPSQWNKKFINQINKLK
jgi:hypothetical protein